MGNPVLAYAGAESRAQDIEIVLIDGTASTVRGTVGLAETSAGEAGAPFADAGPLAWIDYGGDVQQIEFCEYVDVTGTRVHRRVVKREIIGTVFPVVKLNLSREATVLPTIQRDFSPLDFGPDFG